MKKYILSVVISALCATAQASNQYNSAKATIYNKDGVALGKVEFTQHNDGVEIKVDVAKLPAGFHGFHIHAVGQCVVANTIPATAPFASAMGHFKRNPNAPSNHQNHSGDFPVLLVNQDSKVKTVFKTDRFKIKDLFDADGSAVIIHADADNYANIPAARYTQTPIATPPVTGADATTLATGDSGARSACGVVKR
jgi:superoxide dismutase, Cu-Zn family